ncbi:MAG: exodeoxyribonuclease III [Oscillospiraceae bacterium]|jgi:exodeoxyribonuclease-3|nr:exodeoxyribonuclease III [Oscillospiraceae bacterium]
MHLVSWNVNGLRSCMKKGFAEAYEKLAPDVLCLQEIKLSDPAAVTDALAEGRCGGVRLWHPATVRKGYSGTAALLGERQEPPLSVRRGFGGGAEDGEGRVLTLEFPAFFLVTAYTPNAQDGLRRIEFRMAWEDAFRAYLASLDVEKPVILCGDLNVAHNPIDLKNPAANRGNAGYSDQERGKFGELLGAGFADTFRELFPDRKDSYTWWSFISHARERNSGWRIDYFLVSRRIMDRVEDALIYDDIMGSDHCPVGLRINI